MMLSQGIVTIGVGVILPLWLTVMVRMMGRCMGILSAAIMGALTSQLDFS